MGFEFVVTAWISHPHWDIQSSIWCIGMPFISSKTSLKCPWKISRSPPWPFLRIIFSLSSLICLKESLRICGTLINMHQLNDLDPFVKYTTACCILRTSREYSTFAAFELVHTVFLYFNEKILCLYVTYDKCATQLLYHLVETPLCRSCILKSMKNTQSKNQNKSLWIIQDCKVRTGLISYLNTSMKKL